MENVRMTYYENLKRYWRRRKYQRLHGSNHNKRKLKIIRLGDHGTTRRQCKTRGQSKSNKPQLTCLRRLFSPIKLLAKLHDTCVDIMNRLAGNVAHRTTGAGAFSGKKVAKSKQISVISDGEELVDIKLVLEIYKRLAASREMNSIAYY